MGKFNRFLVLLSGIYTGPIVVLIYALVPLAVVTLVVYALINQATEQPSATADIFMNSEITVPDEVLVIAIFAGVTVMLFNRFGWVWLKKCFNNTG